MFHILFVTTLFALAVGETIPKRRVCCSTLGHAESAKISGAQVKDGKYIFKKDLNVEVYIAFEMYQEVKRAFVALHGISLTSRVSEGYKIENPDVCKGQTCPLRKNEKYELKRELVIPLKFYEGGLFLEVTVIDKQSNDTIACALLPAIYEDN